LILPCLAEFVSTRVVSDDLVVIAAAGDSHHQQNPQKYVPDIGSINHASLLSDPPCTVSQSSGRQREKKADIDEPKKREEQRLLLLSSF
jgi:hypothetical protein